jgi:glutamate synthase domain-containing protein 2
VVDTQAFGTRRLVEEEGYEWVSHSIWPKTVREESKRVVIGNKQCSLPYSASRLNVSAMSYGAISDAAIRALNKGAKQGGFYTNTGEGGVSRFHLEHGGDIVWNIGTGYFGCRDRKTGRFDPQQFVDRAKEPGNAIKMIELKLSQGAKPAHGGLLPGAKVTSFIAEARGVAVGEDCHSPASHAEFQDPRGLVLFVQRLRELSGGKPVGFKLCMGRPAEVAAIVGAMVELQIYPDFITVDGSEGGTGAAPPEFSNHVGWPLSDAVTFIHNTLEGAGVREHVKIIASGKILSGFSMVRTAALGADVMNSARAMLFSIGCIQSVSTAGPASASASASS